MTISQETKEHIDNLIRAFNDIRINARIQSREDAKFMNQYMITGIKQLEAQVALLQISKPEEITYATPEPEPTTEANGSTADDITGADL